MSNPDLGYDRLYWPNILEFELESGRPGWAGCSEARLKLTPMIGYTYRSERGIEALGGVFWFDRYQPEGRFAARPDFVAQKRRSMWVHRAALEVVELAHRLSPVIYARADSEIPRSKEWLERLGFAPPDYPGEWWTHGMVLSGGASGRVISDKRRRHGGNVGGDCGGDGIRLVPARQSGA